MLSQRARKRDGSGAGGGKTSTALPHVLSPVRCLLAFIDGELKEGSPNHLCFKWKSKPVAGQSPAAVSPRPALSAGLEQAGARGQSGWPGASI